MATYIQAERPLRVATPLDQDALLLTGFAGREAISQPFEFQLSLVAEIGTPVAFEKLLGQKVTFSIELAGGLTRHFAGICKSVGEGPRDHTFASYRMEVVPQFWLLSKRAQSRIFQQLTVPEILKRVLEGLDIAHDLRGDYRPRDYCVQYRETDFNFASRLMEEEGIFYYFRHSAAGHTMVVTDVPAGYVDPQLRPTVFYEQMAEGAAHHGLGKVQTWEKTQELRSGKFTLRDHCFELPHKPLDAEQLIIDGVRAGQVVHKLKLAGNDRLEVYDYPGEYAQRFDGVNPGGGDRAADVQHIFNDNKRTVALRMQEEAAAGLVIRGTSAHRQFAPGHTFVLKDHHNADGGYLTTGVYHDARMSASYRSGDDDEFFYQNTFECIPLDMGYRPARSTPKPFVQGHQTAVVVGPPGDEIFVDKYGRVKVQFHWDRQGGSDAGSSCWVRVGTPLAGRQWGMIHIPRVGQEVIVDFEEGDPDQPLIIGGVYNADMMPPYDLPANKTRSGIKTRSTPNGTPSNFNELRFEDKSGSEDVYFHAERNFHRVVEVDDDLKVGHDQTIEIGENRTEVVKRGDETVTIDRGNRTVTVANGDDAHRIKMGNRSVVIDMGNDSLTIKMGNQTTKLDLGASTTEALQSIELKVGQSSIKLDQVGVTIKGMTVKVEGQILTEIKGTMTQVKGDAMLIAKGGITMIN